MDEAILAYNNGYVHYTAVLRSASQHHIKPFTEWQKREHGRQTAGKWLFNELYKRILILMS